MSRVRVTRVEPADFTELVASDGQNVEKGIFYRYSALQPPFGFKGRNNIPPLPVFLILILEQGRHTAEVEFDLSSFGLEVYAVVYNFPGDVGVIDPRGPTSFTRPLRIKHTNELTSPTRGLKSIIVEVDVTLDNQGNIVKFDQFYEKNNWFWSF